MANGRPVLTSVFQKYSGTGLAFHLPPFIFLNLLRELGFMMAALAIKEAMHSIKTLLFLCCLYACL